MKMLGKLNKYYDNIKEPGRFSVAMMIIAVPLIVFGMLGLTFNLKIFEVLSYVWIAVLVAIRMWWVHSKGA